MKILVAEDNPLNLELVKDLLELDGHTVEVAEDGVRAVELAGRLQPDVVLMDIQLPRLDRGLAAGHQPFHTIRHSRTQFGEVALPCVKRERRNNF